MVAVAMAAVVVACSQPAEAPSEPKLRAAAGGLPALPAPLACAAPLGPDLLACVNGRAVTRAAYAAAAPHYPAGTPPRAIVQALIDEQLLVNAAVKAGFWRDDLRDDADRALAGQLLVRAIDRTVTVDRIAAADVAEAFKNPQVRLRYEHATGYYVTDVQLLCCSGDWRQCQKRDEVRVCIEQNEAQARRLHQRLAADPPRSPAEMQGRVAALRGEFPTAAVAQVEFWYDKSKTYEQQKGYDLMVREFALPVVELQPGQLAPAPIRTPFGWHIPRLDQVKPAERRTPADPAVHREIAEHVIDAVREREAQRFVFELFRRYGVQFRFEAAEQPGQSARQPDEP
jgi:peptidyl-prolyl cis-trans isomerase C